MLAGQTIVPARYLGQEHTLDATQLPALLAHRTQVDPNSKFWFGLPPEVQREIHPYEDYILGRSVSEPKLPEVDLFAGLRETVDS